MKDSKLQPLIKLNQKLQHQITDEMTELSEKMSLSLQRALLSFLGDFLIKIFLTAASTRNTSVAQELEKFIKILKITTNTIAEKNA